MENKSDYDMPVFEKFSQFNMSIATLQRIDSLLQGLNSAHLSADVLLLHRGSLTLYNELEPFLKPDERDFGRNKLSILRNCIFCKDNEVNFSESDLVLLHDFELWQRCQLQEKGLLMSKGDDPRNAFRS